MMRFIGIFSLCVLALLSVSVGGSSFPLDPPIKLPPKPLIFESQSADDYDERVLSPVADAFVASSYPYDWKEYGKEEFVLVGRHETLGDLTTFLSYTWSLPGNFLYVTEAVLLFGAGGGNEQSIEVDIKRTESFDEDDINDQTKPKVISEATSGKIGKLGYWYGFDVTETVNDAVQSYKWGNSIFFGMYMATPDWKLYKVSSSREDDPAFAPQLYVQHLVDYEAPTLELEPSPEWMQLKVDKVHLHVIDGPDPATKVRTDVEKETGSGNWSVIQSYNRGGGYTMSFGENRQNDSGFVQYRARAEDRFGNAVDYIYTDPIQLYWGDITGWITDHRYHKLPAVDPNLDPEPWYINYDEEQESFTARLRTEYATMDPQVAGYGSWGPTAVFRWDPNREKIVAPLPPIDNLMPEVGAADNLRNWELIGSGRLMVIRDYGIHKPSMQFIAEDTSVSYICPKETYSVDELNQPTLGLFYLTNVNLWMTWQHEDGTFERIQKIMHTPDGWEYDWLDYGAVRQQPGRPCFEFDPWIVQNAYMVFDSISLGSTRSNFGLVISPPAQLPPPGEPYPIDLIVTNHSPYPATAMLHLTVKDEAKPQSWLLPELAPRQTTTRSVILVSPAEEDTLWVSATVGKPEIDDTPWRNTAEWMPIRDATPIYQPLVLGQ